MVILFLYMDELFLILIGKGAGKILSDHFAPIANAVIERIVEDIGKTYKRRNGKSESIYQKKNTI